MRGEPSFILELSTPTYPNASEEGLDCIAKFVTTPGSQIAVNFLDMDIWNHDESSCLSDYLLLTEDSVSSSNYLLQKDRKFCGQQLPNYPGPSMIVSGINNCTMVSIFYIPDLF